jgi:hypothetical protein
MTARLRYFEQRLSGERVEHDPDDHLAHPRAELEQLAGPRGRDARPRGHRPGDGDRDQQAETHRNGARISGMYSVKPPMGPDKFEQLSAWLARFRQGGDKAGEPLILDNEAKFQPFQMTSVEAQTLESRGLQVEEICRTFRVMPIMVGHSDKAATYASAEQMFLAHVVHCLMPWYERWCTSADVNLLSEAGPAERLLHEAQPERADARRRQGPGGILFEGARRRRASRG